VTAVTVTRLTRDEAVALALRENPTLRAKGFEVRATQANEVTAALHPNPTASYSADQLGGRTADPQYIVTVGQPIETGGKRARRGGGPPRHRGRQDRAAPGHGPRRRGGKRRRRRRSRIP